MQSRAGSSCVVDRIFPTWTLGLGFSWGGALSLESLVASDLSWGLEGLTLNMMLVTLQHLCFVMGGACCILACFMKGEGVLSGSIFRKTSLDFTCRTAKDISGVGRGHMDFQSGISGLVPMLGQFLAC